MIKKVAIKLNQSLICGGMAIVTIDDHDECIDFDVVKSAPDQRVIVGGCGKRISEDQAELLEKALLELFIRHGVPMEIGTYVISA